MIDSFRGEFEFLSNFAPAPIRFFDQILCLEVRVPTAEHMYQAGKTVNPGWRYRILNADSPNASKRLGKAAPMREDWNDVRVEWMRGVLRAKFEQNPTLMSQLRQTAPHELVEGNTWGDKFWGVCGGVGENWLGRLLVELRDGE